MNSTGVRAPFYGVNIWRAKKKNLIRAINNMLKLAGPGLTGMFGQVHSLRFYEDEGRTTFTVVLVYEWTSLPADGDVQAPLSILSAHFSFIRSVEAYNWTLVEELDADLEGYVLKLDEPFHEDLCEDR